MRRPAARKASSADVDVWLTRAKAGLEGYLCEVKKLLDNGDLADHHFLNLLDSTHRVDRELEYVTNLQEERAK